MLGSYTAQFGEGTGTKYIVINVGVNRKRIDESGQLSINVVSLRMLHKKFNARKHENNNNNYCRVKDRDGKIRSLRGRERLCDAKSKMIDC